MAALAYGTATVPRVDKIVGPGNRWVAEAKRQVVGQVGIDMIAGPTEVLIIADATARPERVAADLVAQAEHDEDAVSWCVTTDPALAEALPAALEAALARAPRAAIARTALERNGLIVLVPSMREAIEVANRRAPEHLEIVAEGAERVASAIRHAGAIFLGRRYPRAGRRLPGRAEPRAADRRHGALRLAARRLRLRQADQRDPVHAGSAGGGRGGDHRAGGSGRAVGACGGGAGVGAGAARGRSGRGVRAR